MKLNNLMKQRLFRKYFFIIGLLVAFSLMVMLVFMSAVFGNQLSHENSEVLKKSCLSVSDYFKQNQVLIGEEDSETEVYNLINTFSDISGADYFFLDNLGVIEVCYCDEWGKENTCEHSGARLKGEFLTSNGKFSGLSTLGIYTERRYTVSLPLENKSGDFLGYIVAADTVPSLKIQIAALSKIYLFAAILPILILFLAMYIISYRLTKPLKLMSNAAKSMAMGDFSKRIPVTSDDEIGELAVSFNQMSNSLSRLEGMRKSFVADVSHELRTPVTTIGGFIDGILDGTIEPERQKYYLSIASDEVKRLSRMVESMLSISRLESEEFALKYEKFDFKDLLLSVVISQEQQIEQKKLEISGLDLLESITLNADRDLIYRAIYNLVDNAIKFCNEGGKISFTADITTQNLNFSIKNTGKGIKKEEMPYIFERFYKLDKSRSANKKSTGLGLYIVKTIIKKHNGSITVHSRENEYTAFTVQLPILKGKNDE